MNESEVRLKFKSWSKGRVPKLWKDQIEDLVIGFLKHLKLLNENK